MRYAIESSEDMKTRMKIDAILVTSLKAIPAHVTAGVVTGNVYDRFQRVVMFFDDVTRGTIIEQVDASLSSLVKKEKECFAAFTSRFKNIEYQMQQQGLVIDPQLMLAKLGNAILHSTDGDAKEAMRQVRLTVGLATTTTEELLSAMASPMREREKERKVDKARVKTAQDTVNLAWVARGNGGGGRGGGAGGRGKGGGGRGGGAGKGGGKGGGKGKQRNVCIKFAEGTCTWGNKCTFVHKQMGAAELAALKETVAAKYALREGGKGGKGKGGARYTSKEVANALKTAPAAGAAQQEATSLAEKCAKLREQGLDDDQILSVAKLLLDAK
jgi:uncharacterized membrane protein YgcG